MVISKKLSLNFEGVFRPDKNNHGNTFDRTKVSQQRESIGQTTMHQSKHAHMIVRIVDNFLLVTTDKETCQRFLSKMYQGIPDLGVKINKAKTKASCSMKLINSDEVVPSIFAVGEKKNDDASCCFFPWCGFLFDTSSCEVRVDYSRSSGTQAIDSLTVW